MEFLNVLLVSMLFVLGSWRPELAAGRDLQDASVAALYLQWKAEHGRVYTDSAEEAMRFGIFKDNVARIQDFNNNGGNRTYQLAFNKFADLTKEEFLSQTGRFVGHESSQRPTSFRYENVTDIPDAKDWRSEGAVTGVKDQGRCGKCLSSHSFVQYLLYYILVQYIAISILVILYKIIYKSITREVILHTISSSNTNI